jgi:cholesterol transport system auxiliary component
MLYRLDYSNNQQSRAYAQARWSMPVPELLEQRLRQRLSAKHAVLNPADGVQSRQQGVILRVELEDFSQAFSAADQASAQVRVRATLSAWRGGVEHLLAQRSFQAVQPCASADAPGGVRALATATDQVLADLERWLDDAAVR